MHGNFELKAKPSANARFFLREHISHTLPSEKHSEYFNKLNIIKYCSLETHNVKYDGY